MSQQFCCQKKLQVYVILYFILLENEFFYCLNNSTTKPAKSYDVGFRIVGGAICAVKYPFFVSIQRENIHFCGGTLISSHWVLTAAHCTMGFEKRRQFLVRVGITHVFSQEGQTSFVTKCYPHPKFDFGTLVNDIALLRLETAILQSNDIRYVVFANQYMNDALCGKGTILGFGDQSRKDIDMNEVSPKPYNPKLQCAEITVTSQFNCLNEDFVDSKKFCAIGPAGSHTDACQGDSGGPFMCGEIQYGITSEGIGCGVEGIPGSYVTIKKYTRFIEHIMTNEAVTFFISRPLYIIIILFSLIYLYLN